MGLISKILAEGTLTTEASLYSPGANFHGTNVSLIIHNTGASTRTVTTKLKKFGGTARVIDICQLGDDQSRVINGIHLGPGDELRALQDSGTDCSFVVQGATEGNIVGGSWRGMHAVKAGSQSLTSANTWTKITGWTETFDTDGAFTDDTYTVPADGQIKVMCNLFMLHSSGSPALWVAVAVDGTPHVDAMTVQGIWAATAIMQLTHVVRLNVSQGEEIELYAAVSENGCSIGNYTWTGPDPDVVVKSFWDIDFYA